jgi:hypothetical protein
MLTTLFIIVTTGGDRKWLGHVRPHAANRECPTFHHFKAKQNVDGGIFRR